jgi:excisionase family DNA binding protein
VLGVSEYRVTLAEEDRRQLALQFVDLLREARGEERRSFGALAEAWLKRVVRVRVENEESHVRHMAELIELREPGEREAPDDLTKAAIEACFAKLDKRLGGTLGPASLNKLRSTGKLIIDDAVANRWWRGANPFTAVKCRRVPRKPWPRITAEEFVRVLMQLSPDRARQALVSLCTGIRPGEMKALRKADVDLARGMLDVHRSLGRDETKTGIARIVPIPDICREALKIAMELSPSEFVFPRADGRRQRDDAKLSRVLRTAFKKAGVVTGFRFTCRRSGCSHIEERSTAAEINCTKCSMRLWCEPIPRPFTWYSLRHAAATLHREAGGDALAVKMALGWIQRDVGDDVYTHFSDARYRAELNRLALPSGDVANACRVDSTAGVTSQERRKGFEPSTPSLGSKAAQVAFSFLAPESLLTVAQLAEALAVSTDTVYRLASSGRIPSIRIANCMRFSRSAVVELLASKRKAVAQ